MAEIYGPAGKPHADEVAAVEDGAVEVEVASVPAAVRIAQPGGDDGDDGVAELLIVGEG